MNQEDRVLRALNTLKQADQDKEAPASVEANLRKAFRAASVGQVPGLPPAKLAKSTLLALAAAALIAVLLPRISSPKHDIAITPPPAIVTLSKPAPPAVPLPKPAPQPIRNPVPQPPREVVTDFFPLMDIAPPLGRGELLRVRVPASAMLSVGLPVSEDRLNDPIQADILIGEEGLAHAIRFVSWQ